MPGLFELDDYAETRVPWVPVSSMERCRDCGQRSGISQGGSRRGLGVFVVCDACAALDGCGDDGSGRHVSFWGGWHAVADHDGLAAEQERRRAQARRRAAA